MSKIVLTGDALQAARRVAEWWVLERAESFDRGPWHRRRSSDSASACRPCVTW